MAKKTNITLKLDADLLRRVKVIAAERGTSVSAIMAAELHEMIAKEDAYEEAKRRAMALMREGWNLGWKKPKSRDELHER
jgi:predicted transcriptional regulator